MLVVSRLKDQSMMIGDDLMVTLAEIHTERALLLISHKTGDRITFWEELSRHWADVGLSLTLAPEIAVTAWIKNGQVRLGFVCPHEMHVHRKEIYDLIHPDR